MRHLMLFLFTFSSIALTGYILMAGQDLIVPLVIAIVNMFVFSLY